MSIAGLYGGIEAGGTKFVCVIGRDPSEIVAEARIATTSPSETIARCIEFFRSSREASTLDAVGVASFGPCDLDSDSPTYGYITSTPKPGWENTDMIGPLRSALSVPVAMDTDVNAAAMAEHVWGAGSGRSTCLYLTIGTGIGGGYVVDRVPLHGLQHPEMGHIRIPHDLERDPFAGSCPYHGDCLEGLASGPAIRARFGCPGEDLPDEHPFWKLEAEYLGAAIANLVLVLSPEVIVVGGGIMDRAQLLPRVRDEVRLHLRDYIRQPRIMDGIGDYIVAPLLGNRSGVLGAIALAALQAGERLEGAGT